VDKQLQRLRGLIRKESLQLLRDRRLLVLLVGYPIVEVLLFGYAAQLSVYHLPTAIVDQSQDARSRDFVQALVTSQYFDETLHADRQAEAVAAMDRGEVRAAIVIPPRFATSVDRGSADVLILLDGSDSASVQSGYSAAALVAQNYGLQVSAGHLSSSSSGLPIETSTQVLYNPDLIDIWFILPGLVGLVVQTLAVQQAALSVVRDYELGTIEQILATPVRPIELMIGKLVPLLAVVLAGTVAVVAIGTVLFGVPFAGSPLDYATITLLFVVSCLGLGLLVSARAKTQMDATQMGLVFMLVGVLLSGFLYPAESMPLVPRLIGGLFPVTYFIRLSRAIFTRGAGLSVDATDVLILAVYSLAVIALAARNFKTRLG
jgi:drug efflux transport system permease protein